MIKIALNLDSYQLSRLLDCLEDQRDGVRSGSISGYANTREDELNDIDELIRIVEQAHEEITKVT